MASNSSAVASLSRMYMRPGMKSLSTWKEVRADEGGSSPQAPAHGLDVRPRLAWAATRPPACGTCQDGQAARRQSWHSREARGADRPKSSGPGPGLEPAPPRSSCRPSRQSHSLHPAVSQCLRARSDLSLDPGAPHLPDPQVTSLRSAMVRLIPASCFQTGSARLRLRGLPVRMATPSNTPARRGHKGQETESAGDGTPRAPTTAAQMGSDWPRGLHASPACPTGLGTPVLSCPEPGF